jgi:hypothetical protein
MRPAARAGGLGAGWAAPIACRSIRACPGRGDPEGGRPHIAAERANDHAAHGNPSHAVGPAWLAGCRRQVPVAPSQSHESDKTRGPIRPAEQQDPPDTDRTPCLPRRVTVGRVAGVLGPVCPRPIPRCLVVRDHRCAGRRTSTRAGATDLGEACPKAWTAARHRLCARASGRRPIPRCLSRRSVAYPRTLDDRAAGRVESEGGRGDPIRPGTTLGVRPLGRECAGALRCIDPCRRPDDPGHGRQTLALRTDPPRPRAFSIHGSADSAGARSLVQAGPARGRGVLTRRALLATASRAAAARSSARGDAARAEVGTASAASRARGARAPARRRSRPRSARRRGLLQTCRCACSQPQAAERLHACSACPRPTNLAIRVAMCSRSTSTPNR